MDYKKLVKNKEKRLKIANFLFFIPDKPYLKFCYKLKTGKKLNLKHPTGFNEKINYLKLVDKGNKTLTTYVDKISAKNFVRNLIGDKYLIKTYGPWKKFNDIDFSSLPDSFVLKCNHDSGSVVIVKDKKELTEQKLKELKTFYKSRLKIKPHRLGREYPYKYIKPMIFAEDFVTDETGYELKDYKFFCFDGEPKFLYVAKDRSKETTFDFYDLGFNRIDLTNIHEQSKDPLKTPPKCFNEMIELSKKLSKGFKFVRIDFYATANGPLFGEFTLYHGSGFYLFKPDYYERLFGSYISL